MEVIQCELRPDFNWLNPGSMEVFQEVREQRIEKCLVVIRISKCVLTGDWFLPIDGLSFTLGEQH